MALAAKHWNHPQLVPVSAALTEALLDVARKFGVDAATLDNERTRLDRAVDTLCGALLNVIDEAATKRAYLAAMEGK